MSNDTNKRPILVWVIFIVTLLGFIQFCFFIGVNFGLIPLDKEFSGILTQQYTFFKSIKMVAMNTLFLFAGIMLFRLKAISFKLYLLYAILSIISLIYSLLFPTIQIPEISSDMGQMIDVPLNDIKNKVMFYTKIISILFIVFPAYYSFRLLKKNILKP